MISGNPNAGQDDTAGSNVPGAPQMSKSARIVHTPGEQPAAEVTRALDPDGNPGGNVDQADAGADELEQLRAENAALKAEAQQRAQRDAAIAASDSAAMSEKLTSNRPEAGLRAADVDPTKIKRAVLTLDGWVCPEVSPAFQAH